MLNKKITLVCVYFWQAIICFLIGSFMLLTTSNSEYMRAGLLAFVVLVFLSVPLLVVMSRSLFAKFFWWVLISSFIALVNCFFFTFILPFLVLEHMNILQVGA